jgi:hypothetical protein
MAKEISIEGKPAKKGERLTKGSGYVLVATKGKNRFFTAKLRHIINAGDQRFVVLEVPK